MELDQGTWALLISFWGLLLFTAISARGLSIFRRDWEDWLIDGSGLLVQGTVIPLVQIYGIAIGLNHLFPLGGGAVLLHPVLSFGLCFVGVDYLYYWNHRLLHRGPLWNIHVVHHTARQMDVLTTSRNTVWSSVFIVYLWCNGFLVYVLQDPRPYLAAVSATAILDLWRHSPLQPSGIVGKFLGRILILPQDHAWHHAHDRCDINFGANLNVWDKLHHTWYVSEHPPKRLGVETELSVWSKLLWPFSGQ